MALSSFTVTARHILSPVTILVTSTLSLPTFITPSTRASRVFLKRRVVPTPLKYNARRAPESQTACQTIVWGKQISTAHATEEHAFVSYLIYFFTLWKSATVSLYPSYKTDSPLLRFLSTALVGKARVTRFGNISVQPFVNDLPVSD